MGKRDGKTEQATPRRRKEAKREGQLPRSQETTTMLVTAVAIITLMVTAPSALRVTAVMMRDWLRSADPEVGMRAGALGTSVMDLTVAWFPCVIAAVLAGIVATVAQGGLVIMPKTARPSLKNLSVKRGLSQLNPAKAGYTLFRNAAKFILVGGALIAPIQALWQTLPIANDLMQAAALTGRALSSILIRVIAGSVIIAVIDQVVTRRRWRRDLMMSKQELIDEAKRSEGDPHAKAARKRRGMEMRRRGSLRSVSMADVIITNPTHYAVALAYAEGAAAPQVISKGTEAMAKKIRREASRHGVPIIENRPLARALHRQVPIGGFVPERFFDDVVKVLVAAYWRRGAVPTHVQSRPIPTGAAR